MSYCHLSRSKFLLFLIPCFILGCSFHYDQGLELEKQKRWAEAAIEYRIAAVENPNNEDIKMMNGNNQKLPRHSVENNGIIEPILITKQSSFPFDRVL